MADLCATDLCPNLAEWYHPERYVAFCADHYPLRDLMSEVTP